ncbi:MAG: hypothetical protein AAF253_12720 [Pseudomonadota bacterium]
MALGHIQDNADDLEVGVSGLEIDLNQVGADVAAWLESVVDQVWSLGSLWQVFAVIASAAVGYVLSRPVAKWLKHAAETRELKDILFRL